MSFFPAKRSYSYGQQEIDATLRLLLGRFFLLFLFAGTLSLVGSLVRVFEFGWMFQQIIHAVVYILLITTFLLLKKAPVAYLALTLFALTGIDAVTNLFTFGLASTGTLMLGYIVIMITTFVSYRAGIVSLGIVIVLLSGFGLLISNGVIPMNYDATRYVASWSAWLTQISTFIIMITTAVVASGGIKKRLLATLHTLEERTTALTKANNELIRSEQKIRTIIATAPEAIITMNSDFMITSSNDLACKLFRYSNPGELIGKNLLEFIIAGDKNLVKQKMKRLGEQSVTTVRDMEFLVSIQNGKECPVRMSTSLLHNDDGIPEGFLAILQDITASIEMEEHLRQSEKMEAIGQLAGGIAHDFNNQLTGIIGFADLLKSSLSNTEQLDDVKAIIQTAERASSLTTQLLAFSRKGRNKTVTYDLHTITLDVASMLSRTLDKNIIITQNLKADSPLLTGDPAQIQNVLLNLALNARDAMPDGGTITFSTKRKSGTQIDSFYPFSSNNKTSYILLSVKDSGTGMDLETQKRMFEPFFTTKEPGKGTGMGLATVYSTIKNHGGKIDVESAPGKGTEILLYLPVLSAIELDEK